MAEAAADCVAITREVAIMLAASILSRVEPQRRLVTTTRGAPPFKGHQDCRRGDGEQLPPPPATTNNQPKAVWETRRLKENSRRARRSHAHRRDKDTVKA